MDRYSIAKFGKIHSRSVRFEVNAAKVWSLVALVPRRAVAFVVSDEMKSSRIYISGSVCSSSPSTFLRIALVSRSFSARGSSKMPSLYGERVPGEAVQGEQVLQLIDAQGTFDEAGLNSFVKAIRLDKCGCSYAVVAIMGPQSSGKSTLLNHLFRTSFREMDAIAGRTQTTQGVWLACAKDIVPCTIVMDLEGTDGQERGEDDTAFEKQSALFALAVSDILIINMWCHDIGREQAANKPLLKIVFEVLLRMKMSCIKKTLLFVIRDQTRTPLDSLDTTLRRDVKKIWESVPKSSTYAGRDLSEFFTVEVRALPNYEGDLDRFDMEVSNLRKLFNDSIEAGGLAGDRREVVAGAGFSTSSSKIWKTIKENKYLDLPKLKVMVATVKCNEIVEEKLKALSADPVWQDLDESAKKGSVPGFGKRLSDLLDKHLSAYDVEAKFYEDSVKEKKRKDLLTGALYRVQPAYDAIVSNLRKDALNELKSKIKDWGEDPAGEEGFAAAVRRCSAEALSKFDKGYSDADVSQAHWDNGELRKKLQRDIDSHAQTVKAEKLEAIVLSAKKQLENALPESIEDWLDDPPRDIWFRKRLSRETDKVKSALSSAVAGFEPNKDEIANMLDSLTKSGRETVERQAKKAASEAQDHMRKRFNESFNNAQWSKDIPAKAKNARTKSLKCLAVLAVFAPQLEDDVKGRIEAALSTLISEDDIISRVRAFYAMSVRRITSLFRTGGERASTCSPLAATSWEGVPLEVTLLTPDQCKGIWRKFKDETDETIQKAVEAQARGNRESSWIPAPPAWLGWALLFLGMRRERRRKR